MCLTHKYSIFYQSLYTYISSQFVIKDSVLSAKASSQDSQNTATPAILLTNVDEVHCVLLLCHAYFNPMLTNCTGWHNLISNRLNL